MEYVRLENKLQEINTQCIQISNKKMNNNSIKEILQAFTNVMSSTCVLFKTMHENIIFNGSYYNNLKISKADEYDLDLILALPVELETALLLTADAGYANVRVNVNRIRNIAHYRDIVTPLEKLCDNGILSSLKFHSWFEGLVQKSLNYITVNNVLPSYRITMHKSGPAVTLTVATNNSTYDMDLVPCLKLNKSLYPAGYKGADCIYFYAVPKPNVGIEWRLSFIQQEVKRLKDHGHVKQAIRLLKFLRDQREHKLIKSYFIVTVAMWELDKTDFKGQSLSFTFMTLLESFYNHIKRRTIPFYWNPSSNLLIKCNSDYLFNLENQLFRILNKLKSSNFNPDVLYEVFKFPIQES